MKDISKFIGIPYGFNMNSYSQADCAGLTQLFYCEHGYQPQEYPKPTEHEWWIKNPFLMERFLLKNFDKTKNIQELKYGDLILTEISGESHLLIYLEYGKCLTTFPPGVKQWDGSEMPDRSCIVRKDIWLHGFKMGFKRRG
jgi:cell wall-associated NlpC family hydrolase